MTAASGYGSGSASASKDVLRAALLAARRTRPADEVARARSAVRAHVLARCAAAGWRTVAAYEPLRTEPGSVELLGGLHSTGVRVLVPLTQPDHDLDWAVWTPDRVAAPLAVTPGDLGELGVDAVSTADAVLVPALAVGRDGTRLGRGRGSYDRALRRVRPGVDVAALLFDDELRATLPTDAWDIAVHVAVTPGGWYAVGRNTGAAPGD